MKKSSNLIIALLLSMSTLSLNAQNFTLAVGASHLLDIYEGRTDLGNGLSDIDMAGDHSAANFSLSYGINALYHLNQTVTLGINAEIGSMSGAFETQYYDAKVGLYTAGLNLNMFREEESKFWPFLRISAGLGTYNSERKFIAEDIVFSTTKGTTLECGIGLGFNITLSEDLAVRLGSELVLNLDDGWDGYDNGQVSDMLLKSGLKVAYTFNPRSMGYQKVRVPGKR